MSVKAKKHLGQHFLKDSKVAQKIANSLTLSGYDKVLEIGPGMGALTAFLLEKATTTYVIEIDVESVAYLRVHYPSLSNRIFETDVLKFDFSAAFSGTQFAIIGNFPYSISTQIVFKMLENSH